ncbi:MAG: iron ABC transporter permease, partial [Hyphomicrobiaceae bacterium]|nr:iron ABC transporter permease [Hyphomicrobiaceae bacterium]
AILLALVVGWLVLMPVMFLVEKTFNVGDPLSFPASQYGTGNLLSLFTEDFDIIANTVYVALMATVMAVLIGFTMAWILTRTNVAGRERLERLMEVPYYMTPLVGALAWAVLAAPKSGFFNQAWHAVGGKSDLFDIYTLFGIAWVMALFEGTVAYVMISASMKSMDPALEESARVMGASKLRTTLTVTLPLVLPGVLGATLFVFAEMLGSFAAALVLGIPGRIYVVTTSIWSTVEAFPPNYGKAAAMGLSLFLVMVAMLAGYRFVISRGSYATITGKAFRPRPMDMGRAAWVLMSVCLLYIVLAVLLPVAALLLTSFQTFATVILSQAKFTLANYQEALALGPVRTALFNSILLGVAVASVGAVVMAVLVWIIYRSRMRGRGLIEYLAMFPSSVPRMVFGLGLLWAWINMPGGLYGSLWLLGIAYFTVLLPLGVRTIAGVVLQIDKSLEECARVCGAGWGYQMRTVTLPLLKPGIIAAWMLLFAASVREVGASLLLMGPHSKVIGPSIVATWANSGTQLTAAMALMQTFVVMLALIILFRVTRDTKREI